MSYAQALDRRAAWRERTIWRHLLALAALLGASHSATAADTPGWANLYPAAFAGSAGKIEGAAPPKNGKPFGKKNGNDEFEVDSEHIFGLTNGSDLGEKGELELEIEPVAALGKRFGTYFATAQNTLFKYSITDNLRVAPGFLFVTHDIRNVPGFADHRQAEIGGALMEIRYRLLNRETAPFGLTISFDPRWNRIDELTGDRVEQYGNEFAILMDKEIIHDRFYAAFNFTYDLSATRLRETGEWFHHSAVGMDFALSYQFVPGILVGAEARHAQQYEGMGLDRLNGEALYVGPTFFARLGKDASLSGAWDVQVAGKAVGEPGPLDLINFERHRLMLRLAILLNPK
jgi:hypothetical protein